MSEPDYTPVTRRSDMILLALGILTFIVFFTFLDAEKALACSVVVGAFVAIIQTKPRGRRDQTFWTAIAVLAVIHVAVLSLIRIPELRFGLVALPFALADGFAIWGLLNWIERRFPTERGGGPTKG